MAYGIALKKSGASVEGYFGGEWPARCLFSLDPLLIKRLGELIVALAAGKKKRFEIHLEAKNNGLYVFGKRNFYRGNTLIRFEFDSVHPHFRVPCHNRFNYDRFTCEELLTFGRELINFDNTGLACIGAEDPAGFVRSFEEELLM
ncbi:MAG: hypothetical protein E7597_07770 [Ruminococcaceae bacterium]|nr:hypothetical protein [Oscillospiraceae bacterium]